jgi:hypothetical protein
MKQFILSRLAESSTWRGIFLVLSAFGIYQLSNDQQYAIESLMLAFFGTFHFMPDVFNSNK